MGRENGDDGAQYVRQTAPDVEERARPTVQGSPRISVAAYLVVQGIKC